MADEGGMDVGGIYITADIKADEFFAKLQSIQSQLDHLSDTAIVVNAAMSGQSPKDIQSALKQMAKSRPTGVPVAPEFVPKAEAILQERLSGFTLVAEVASAVFSDAAITALQTRLSETKFEAKISKFKIDESKLANSVQKALENKTFIVRLKANAIDIDSGGEIVIGKETTVVAGHGAKSKRGKVKEGGDTAVERAEKTKVTKASTSEAELAALKRSQAAKVEQLKKLQEAFAQAAIHVEPFEKRPLTGERTLSNAEVEQWAAARRADVQRKGGAARIRKRGGVEYTEPFPLNVPKKLAGTGEREQAWRRQHPVVWNEVSDEARQFLMGFGDPIKTSRSIRLPMLAATRLAMMDPKTLANMGGPVGDIGTLKTVRRKSPWTKYGPDYAPDVKPIETNIGVGLPESERQIMAHAMIATARHQMAATLSNSDRKLYELGVRQVEERAAGGLIGGGLQGPAAPRERLEVVIRPKGSRKQIVNEENVSTTPANVIFREGLGQRGGGRKGRRSTRILGRGPEEERRIDAYGEPVPIDSEVQSRQLMEGAALFSTPGGAETLPRRKTIRPVAARLGTLSYGQGGIDKRQLALDALASIAAQEDVTVPWQMPSDVRTRSPEALIPKQKPLIGGRSGRDWRDWQRMREEEVSGWKGLSPAEQRWTDWIKGVRIIDEPSGEAGGAGRLTIEKALPSRPETTEEYNARTDVIEARKQQADRQAAIERHAAAQRQAGIADIRGQFGGSEEAAAEKYDKAIGEAQKLTMDTGFGYADRGGFTVVEKTGKPATWDWEKQFSERIQDLMRGIDIGPRGGKRNIGVAFGAAKAYALIQTEIDNLTKDLAKGGVKMGKFRSTLNKKLESIPSETTARDMIMTDAWWEGKGREFGAANKITQPEAKAITLAGLSEHLRSVMGLPTATSSPARRGDRVPLRSGPPDRLTALGMNARGAAIEGRLPLLANRLMAQQERAEIKGWTWTNIKRATGNQIGMRPKKDETQEDFEKRFNERVATQAQLRLEYDAAKTAEERKGILDRARAAGVITEPKLTTDKALQRAAREYYKADIETEAGRAKMFPAGDYSAMKDPREELLYKRREAEYIERAKAGVAKKERLYGKGGVYKQVDEIREKRAGVIRAFRSQLAPEESIPLDQLDEWREKKKSAERSLTVATLEPEELSLFDEFAEMPVSDEARQKYLADKRRKPTTPAKLQSRNLREAQRLAEERAAELQARIETAEAAPAGPLAPTHVTRMEKDIEATRQELGVAQAVRQLTGGYTITGADVEEKARAEVAARAEGLWQSYGTSEERGRALGGGIDTEFKTKKAYLEAGAPEYRIETPEGEGTPRSVRKTLWRGEAEEMATARERLQPRIGVNIADEEIANLEAQLQDRQRALAAYKKTGKPMPQAGDIEELRTLRGTGEPGDTGLIGSLKAKRAELRQAEETARAARKAERTEPLPDNVIQFTGAEEALQAADHTKAIEVQSSGAGLGGGGVVDVNVVNYGPDDIANALAQKLMGTTNRGSLRSSFKGLSDTFEELPEETKQALFEAMGDSKKEAQERVAKLNAAKGLATPPETPVPQTPKSTPRRGKAEAKFEEPEFTYSEVIPTNVEGPPEPGVEYRYRPEEPLTTETSRLNQYEPRVVVPKKTMPKVAAITGEGEKATVTSERYAGQGEQEAAFKTQEAAAANLISVMDREAKKAAAEKKAAQTKADNEQKRAADKAERDRNRAEREQQRGQRPGYAVDTQVRRALGPRFVEARDVPAAGAEILERASRAQMQAEQAAMPERAPSTAVAQVFARATGIKTRYQKAQEAEREAYGKAIKTGEARQELEREVTARKENIQQMAVSWRELPRDSQARKDLTQTIRAYNRETREATSNLQSLQARETQEIQVAQKATETRMKSGGGLASVAQVGALFVGAKAFMVFNQALGEATKLASDVGGRGVDRLLHFQATNDKVTKSLSEQVSAFHGNTQAALGQQAAMVGLSDAAAAFVGEQILPNAVAMAGSRANMGASDMWRAASYREKQTGKYGGFAPGLFEGTGGILGGPLLAEQMGGTPGVLQRVGDDLSKFTEDILATPAIQKQIAGFEANRVQVGPREMAPDQAAYDAAVNAAAAANQGIDAAIGGLQNDLTRYAGAPELRKKYIADLNDTMSRGAMKMGDTLDASFEGFGTTVGAIPEETRKAMESVAMAMGGQVETTINKMIKAGIGIKGLEGKAPAEQQDILGRAVQSFAQGRLTPDKEQYINITKQQLTAQMQGNEMMARFQRSYVIPAQQALERLMNPPTPVAAGVEALIAEVPTTQTKVPKGTGASLTARMTNIQQMQQQEQDIYGDNQKTVLRMIAPEDQTAAQGLLTSLSQVSQRMMEINTQSAQLAANLNAAQYANQRRIMVRDLNDALALAGQRAAAEGGILGILQRQQVMIDRQNQALSLQAQQLSIQLAQRQINFQISAAGFEAPGITGEERAARIEQAKIEAAFAQKQLDIQKQQAKLARQSYRINIQIFDETVARQITDLKAGLDLLDKSYVTNISIQLNEKEVAALDKKRQRVASQLNTYIEKNMANQTALVSAAVTASGIVMGSVNSWYLALSKSFQDMIEIYWKALTNPTGATTTQNQSGRGNTPGAVNVDSDEHAAGFIGNVTGATRMTVGEAGTETVAILRNPRDVSASPMGGGGGTTVVINITGNSVRDDRDLDLLADRIERRLNMKASLLGFRRPI